MGTGSLQLYTERPKPALQITNPNTKAYTVAHVMKVLRRSFQPDLDFTPFEYLTATSNCQYSKSK